jgi:hypothetical protein
VAAPNLYKDAKKFPFMASDSNREIASMRGAHGIVMVNKSAVNSHLDHKTAYFFVQIYQIGLAFLSSRRILNVVYF